MKRLGLLALLVFALCGFILRGGGGGSSSPTTCAVNTVCVTRTITNISGATISGVPQQIGQVFARGDVPGCLSSNTPIPQDHTGANLNYQIDEASVWDDGSCQDLVYTLITPSIANNATEQLKFERVASAYTPGSDPGSTADITTGHDFQMVLTDVRDHTATLVGSGNFTFDVNSCIANGTTWVYATGPYRHGVGVACTAPDTTSANVQTTLSSGITSGTTGTVTVGTIPSGCNTSTTVNQILQIDNEYILAKFVTSTSFNLVTRGAVRSTAASHSGGATITCEGNLFAEFYFDIYRGTGGSIYTIGHMPMVMQPWANIAGADFQSYFADYTDNGVGDVRNWAYTISGVNQGAAVTVGTGAGNEPTRNGSINFGDTTLQRSECVSFSSSGTLPGGISANTPYFVKSTTYPATSGTYQLFTNAQGPSNSKNTSAVATIVDITSTGSGNLTITRRMCQPYRIAWMSAANDAGWENFTANASTMQGIYDALTNTEKQYWIKTSLVPPVDTTLAPNDPNATPSGPDSTLYRPLIAVAMNNNIGAAGSGPGEAPMPNWDVTAFLKEDQSAWDFARAGALGMAGMPYVGQLQEATGHIQPLNGGASRFNASCVDSGANAPYSILGLNQPNFQYSGNHVNGIVTAASGAPDVFSGIGSLSDGVWNLSGGDGMAPSQGHWPLAPHMAYAFMGREWLLDTVYMMANNALMVRQIPAVYGFQQDNKQGEPLGTGHTTYYGVFTYGSNRTDHTIGNVALALASGSATTHQEKAYIADDLQENACYYTAAMANFAAGQTNLGMWDLTTAGGDGLATWWSGWGFGWAYAVTRSALWKPVAQLFAQHFITRWGEGAGGWSSYWGPPEYIANFVAPQNALQPSASWNANLQPNFATTIDHIGFTVPSGNGTGANSITQGSPTAVTAVLASDFNLQNGDEVKCMGDTYGGAASPGTTYTGPPECKPLSNPNGNNEWFFVCNLTTFGTGTNINWVFNFGTDATCATLVDVTSATANLTINSYTYNSTTGAVVLTLSASDPFTISGAPINVSGLNISGLNGNQVLVSGTGNTLTYTGPTGLGGIPSGGGTILNTNYIGNQALAFHPMHSVSVASCVVGSLGCTNWDPGGDSASNRASVNWYASLGLIPSGSATVTNVNARVLVPTSSFQTLPYYDYAVQAVQ